MRLLSSSPGVVNPNGPDKPQDCPHTPLQDYLLLEVIEITESTIVMPDNMELPAINGVVIKMGPGRHSDFRGDVLPMPEIQPGDIVQCTAQSMMGPLPVKWRQHDLFLVRAREVVSVRRDAPWGVPADRALAITDESDEDSASEHALAASDASDA